MKLQILYVSVVVSADQHNPTILHPAFLESQNIVKTDWKLAEPPICTPPFAVVRYENGIAFTVDGSKLQVVDNSPPEEFRTSQIPSLALAYIQKLPHVHYKAVGINIAGFMNCGAAEDRLIQMFLKPGPWNTEKRGLQAVGLRLVYPVDKARLRLNIDPGTAKDLPDSQGEAHGILLKANFHSLLMPSNPLEQAEQMLLMFSDRCDYFVEQVDTIFATEA